MNAEEDEKAIEKKGEQRRKRKAREEKLEHSQYITSQEFQQTKSSMKRADLLAHLKVIKHKKRSKEEWALHLDKDNKATLLRKLESLVQ